MLADEMLIPRVITPHCSFLFFRVTGCPLALTLILLVIGQEIAGHSAAIGSRRCVSRVRLAGKMGVPIERMVSAIENLPSIFYVRLRDSFAPTSQRARDAFW